jgi:DMSO/TMAO reductase YedYZ molybdopterin-dependent catalytic subunit
MHFENRELLMNTLRVEGCVTQTLELTYEQLCDLPAEFQIANVSTLSPNRPGTAITLRAIMELAKVSANAQYLGLHASRDDFHASIPIAPILETAVLIYQLHGQPLDVKSGGPFRFFIPNHAACHTHQIDECANVKFVDRMEFTLAIGQDNRPHDAQQHADLHAREVS